MKISLIRTQLLWFLTILIYMRCFTANSLPTEQFLHLAQLELFLPSCPAQKNHCKNSGCIAHEKTLYGIINPMFAAAWASAL